MSIIGAKFKLKNLPLLTVLWVFGKNYVKSTQSAKSNHTESCFHENSLNFLLRLSPYTVRCGKTRNSLSSEKYFVKSTLLKNEYFSLTEKKNSWNQLLSNFLSKTIAFTKFLWKTCEREFCSHQSNISWNQWRRKLWNIGEAQGGYIF